MHLAPRHRQLLAMLLAQRLRFALAMGCMLAYSATTAIMPLLVKPVLDDIFVNRDVRWLGLFPLMVMIIFMVRGLGMYGQEYLMSNVGERIIRILRTRLYNRIQDLSLAFFHREKTGRLMSRITHDVNIVKAMASTAVTGALRDAFTIVGLTAVIFYRDWKLALIAFVVLPLAFYPVVAFGRRVRRVSTTNQEAMAETAAFLHETLAGVKIVKAFGMENHEKERFARHARRLFDLEMRAVRARALSSPVMEFLGGLGIAAVIWYGGAQVIGGHSTPGTFFSFMAAVLMLYDPVKKLSKLNNAVQEGLAAANRIFDIVECDERIPPPAVPRELAAAAHRVCFEGVDFSYDGRQPVLTGIDLAVPEGQILAIVGMSGGGKTTLVNLIPRFYDVTGGAVRIDGIDVRELSLASLRSRIAVVTQEPILFNDSIRNNIAYGCPEATLTRVRGAARAAYAEDFIERLPAGYDTTIGELGGRLSGGEKQRLCIARALLKDAPILILDEATSSLDTEAEALVQKALENLMRGRTTFVIAHRLSTIAYAHRIIVMVRGRIVEQGRHADLLAAGGVYAKLHGMQFNPAPACAP